MKKLRDFFYDKNDIILAIIILAVAGLLIVWRIDVIMAYPETLARETKTEKTTEQNAVSSKDDKKAEEKKKKEKAAEKKESSKSEVKEEKSTEKADAETESTSLWDSNGNLSKDLTVTVSGASSVDAINSLTSSGLFSSSDQLNSDFASYGTSVESLKSGTFNFSKGATKADVVEILTR